MYILTCIFFIFFIFLHVYSLYSLYSYMYILYIHVCLQLRLHPGCLSLRFLPSAPAAALLVWNQEKGLRQGVRTPILTPLPRHRGVKLSAPEDSASRPRSARLLGKHARHMSPAMTVFAVKDFNLYFHPSIACTPLHTPGDTHTHTLTHTHTHECMTPPLTRREAPAAEGVIPWSVSGCKTLHTRSSPSPAHSSPLIGRLYL